MTGKVMTPENLLVAIAVGARMRFMREEAGLTLNVVAVLMGSHRPIIGRLESGRHMQTVDVIRKYARAVRCAPLEILSVMDGLQQIYEEPGR